MNSIHFFGLMVIAIGLFSLYLGEHTRKNAPHDSGSCSTIFGTARVTLYRDKDDIMVYVRRKDGGWTVFDAPPHAKEMLERTANGYHYDQQ